MADPGLKRQSAWTTPAVRLTATAAGLVALCRACLPGSATECRQKDRVKWTGGGHSVTHSPGQRWVGTCQRAQLIEPSVQRKPASSELIYRPSETAASARHRFAVSGRASVRTLRPSSQAGSRASVHSTQLRSVSQLARCFLFDEEATYFSYIHWYIAGSWLIRHQSWSSSTGELYVREMATVWR